MLSIIAVQLLFPRAFYRLKKINDRKMLNISGTRASTVIHGGNDVCS